MRTEKEIKDFIIDIESKDTVGKEKHTGLTKITDRGDNWIEALNWVLEYEEEFSRQT